MSISESVELAEESNVYARHQSYAMLMFGIASIVAAGLFYFLDPQTTVARWYWVLAGPALGFLVMYRAQAHWQCKELAGPYLAVFTGGVAGCFVMAMAVQSSWIVPASLLLVGVALAFLAWFEQNGLGMTAAVVVAILAGVTSASTLLLDASLISGLFGSFLLLGGASLLERSQVVADASVIPTLRLVDIDLTQEIEQVEVDIKPLLQVAEV